MITSVILSEHPYVLESDAAGDNPTIFYLMPKTVRSTNESAANYSKAFKSKKRTGEKEIDIQAMTVADVKEWLSSVMRVKNYGIFPKSPGIKEGHSSYTYFEAKSAEQPDVYQKKEDGLIVISETSDENDLKNIYFSMSPKDVEEIMAAVVDFSTLKEAEKNV